MMGRSHFLAIGPLQAGLFKSGGQDPTLGVLFSNLSSCHSLHRPNIPGPESQTAVPRKREPCRA